jgi:nucleoside-diphosphate-sugar epimerase
MEFEKVLVTGGAGLLGRYVVAELHERCAVTILDRRPCPAGNRSPLGDVTDLDAMRAAAAGQHAVLHIAAIPNIWSGDADTIMRVNVLGTWNVFQAANSAGVRRVVLCSSDSVIGFTVREGKMLPPLYVPVDLEHPLQATDPYALSKALGEDIARSFAFRGMEVQVLRPVFVAYPEMADEIRVRAKDPAKYHGPMAGGPSAAGGGPLWHYIDPRDAARAFRLALELREATFERFFLSAEATLAPEPTLERLERFLGRSLEIRRPELYRHNPFAPLYELSPSRERLGFTAEYDQRQLAQQPLKQAAEGATC